MMDRHTRKQLWLSPARDLVMASVRVRPAGHGGTSGRSRDVARTTDCPAACVRGLLKSPEGQRPTADVKGGTNRIVSTDQPYTARGGCAYNCQPLERSSSPPSAPIRPLAVFLLRFA